MSTDSNTEPALLGGHKNNLPESTGQNVAEQNPPKEKKRRPYRTREENEARHAAAYRRMGYEI